MPAELLALNDDHDLFLAVRIQRPAGNLDGTLFLYFDNDNDGLALEEFDDHIGAGGVPPTNNFGDAYVLKDAAGFSDDEVDGGAVDGAGAVGSDPRSASSSSS